MYPDLDILENPQAYHPAAVRFAAWRLLNTDALYHGVSPWHLRTLRAYARLAYRVLG